MPNRLTRYITVTSLTFVMLNEPARLAFHGHKHGGYTLHIVFDGRTDRICVIMAAISLTSVSDRRCNRTSCLRRARFIIVPEGLCCCIAIATALSLCTGRRRDVPIVLDGVYIGVNYRIAASTGVKGVSLRCTCGRGHKIRICVTGSRNILGLGIIASVMCTCRCFCTDCCTGGCDCFLPSAICMSKRRGVFVTASGTNGRLLTGCGSTRASIGDHMREVIFTDFCMPAVFRCPVTVVVTQSRAADKGFRAYRSASTGLVVCSRRITGCMGCNIGRIGIFNRESMLTESAECIATHRTDSLLPAGCIFACMCG